MSAGPSHESGIVTTSPGWQTLRLFVAGAGRTASAAVSPGGLARTAERRLGRPGQPPGLAWAAPGPESSRQPGVAAALATILREK